MIKEPINGNLVDDEYEVGNVFELKWYEKNIQLNKSAIAINLFRMISLIDSMYNKMPKPMIIKSTLAIVPNKFSRKKDVEKYM